MPTGYNFKPNDKHREDIRIMMAVGATQEQMAEILGISVDTLVNYFADEFRTGKIRQNREVAKTAYQRAISGQSDAMTAFWLKTQARWRETMNEEEVREIVFRFLSPEQIKKLSDEQ